MTDRCNLIYSIGHSVHELPAFLALLKQHSITAVADVRSQPYSRLAHFNREPLTAALKAQGIEYVFLGRELGARRDERSCYVEGRAAYELITQLPAFREGLRRLAEGAAEHTIAIMCAEKDPVDRHRTVLICRHLRKMGLRIQHILANGSLEEHADTEKRLVEITDMVVTLYDQEMPTSERIEQAYDTRGREIAYKEEQEGTTP